MGLVYPASCPRRDRGADAATRPGRAIPTARRSTPAPTATSTRPRRRGASPPARPTRSGCASTEAAALAGPAVVAGGGRRAGRRDRDIAADPAAWGDVVLARKETPTSYHLSVSVDDAAQGVTHVVRGRDLFHATAVHVLLQRLLGLPTPAYHHHRLITDAAGRKLSKSDRDTSLRSLREAGVTAAEVRAMVGVDAALKAMRWGPSPFRRVVPSTIFHSRPSWILPLANPWRAPDRPHNKSGPTGSVHPRRVRPATTAQKRGHSFLVASASAGRDDARSAQMKE